MSNFIYRLVSLSTPKKDDFLGRRRLDSKYCYKSIDRGVNWQLPTIIYEYAYRVFNENQFKCLKYHKSGVSQGRCMAEDWFKKSGHCRCCFAKLDQFGDFSFLFARCGKSARIWSLIICEKCAQERFVYRVSSDEIGDTSDFSGYF
jgi:hypothetical protein